MRFSKFSTILGFVSLLRTSSSENADIQHKKHKEIPSIAPSPVGPLLSVGLGLIYLSYRSMGGKSPEIIFEEASETIQSFSLENWKELKNTTNHESLGVDILTYSSFFPNRSSEQFFILRKMSSMFDGYVHDCESQEFSGYSITAFYRYLLDFVIIPQVNIFNKITNEEDFPYYPAFYMDYCFKNLKNESGCREPSSTKILKYYILLAETLTDACSKIQMAHGIRYGEFILANDKQNAERLVEKSMELTRRYLDLMKDLNSAFKFMFELIFRGYDFCDEINNSCLPGDKDLLKFDGARSRVRFSLKSVDAPSGYVVTGMRWKVKYNLNWQYIIYIKIQVGKFIDAMRVDESTVRWLDIIESDEHVAVSDIRKISLGQIRLESGRFVTGVQLTSIQDLCYLSIKSSGTDWHGTRLTGEIVQINVTNNFDDITTMPSKFSLDVLEVIMATPAPIGGVKFKFGNKYGDYVKVKLSTYGPNYMNMINEEQFEKYSKLFDLPPRE